MSDVFLGLFNMSITASWLVLAVILLRFLFKRAPKWIMGVLWAFVAVRLVCPFSIESVFSLIPSSETISNNAYNSRPYVQTGFSAADNGVNGYIGDNYYEGVTVPEGNTDNMLRIAFFVWLAGMIAMAVYTLASYLRIKNRVNEAVPYKDNIFLCDSIDTPFVLGLICPRIYLPSDMNSNDMEFVLSHEQAHIKRRDYIWKPLGFLLLTVYWFNPVLWIAYVLFCRDIELACDQRVLREAGEDIKKPYSTALINCSVPRKAIAACPLAFGEIGVKERVKGVLNYKKPAFWIIVIAIIICIITAVCLLTNPISHKNNRLFENVTVDAVGSDRKDVSINVLDIKDDNGKITLKISWSNDSDQYITYGEMFSVSKKENGKWVPLKEKGYWNLPAYSVPPGNLNFIGIKKYILTNYFDITETGTYRFSTDFSFEKDTSEKYSVWVDFTLSDINDSFSAEGGSSNRKIDDRLAVFLDTQIAQHFETEETAGRFVCVNYEILLKKSNKEETTVYMWVLYEEYSCESGVPKEETGAHIPTVITARKNGNNYELAEYWEPRDGSFFVKDIKSKFPIYLWDKAIDGQRYIEKQEAWCRKSAEEYYQSSVSTVGGADGPTAIISAVESYVYSRDMEMAVLTLNRETGRCSFSLSLLSSYFPQGTYREENGYVTMQSDDGQNTYTFKRKGNNLIFVADKSSPMPKYAYSSGADAQVCVPDGAEFVFTLNS